MRLPETNVVLHLIQLCSDRFEQLVSTGADEDVALDRTWDCYEKAVLQSTERCFDPRDRLFESKLRTVVQKG